MAGRIVKVLKRAKVTGGGVAELAVPGECSSSAVSPSAGGACQQARIVESNDEYAIIEIVCSCGRKTSVQCNYSELSKSQ